jgi:demethylmenaquinone methyltransferase / 2-methoxy-6-polyprenyl-1,4-benzoquinol methylase
VKPHPLLEQHYRRPEEKPQFVKDLFDHGAIHYDPVVKWGFGGSGDYYRGWAMRRHGLKPGMQHLDVACGTGLVAVAASKILGGAETITCVDPSDGMLQVAQKKLAARFVKSGGEAMPLPDNTYDFLTLGYALRHFGDLETAFREFRRVLKPGGKVLILEVTKPQGKIGAWLFRLYFKSVYPRLTRLFTRSQDAQKMMLYFWETMDACVPPDQVLAALSAAGFCGVRRIGMAGLFSEYVAVK